LYPEIISQTQNHLAVQYAIQKQATQNVKRLVNFNSESEIENIKTVTFRVDKQKN